MNVLKMAPMNMGTKIRQIVGDKFGAQVMEYNLEKALSSSLDIRRKKNPMSLFIDPLTDLYEKGYMKENLRQGIPFDVLRAMSQTPIVGSIIQTRLNQITAFTSSQKKMYGCGFKVVRMKKMDEEVRNLQLERYMENCGDVTYGETSLDEFARKFMRDSLVLDQACAEVVKTNGGKVAYVVPVDSATIRKLKPAVRHRNRASGIWYAQVVDEQVVAEYKHDEMIFGIRNGSTNIDAYGYGYSELEYLIRIVNTMVNAEKYNTGLLSSGGTQKGVLVVTGGYDKNQFEDFKGKFHATVRTAGDSWRAPVLCVDKGSRVDWLALDRANRDLEYSQLFDFLVKQACGVYSMSPEEINWVVGQTGSKVTFESDRKVKENLSRSRGLRPLLTFLSRILTRHVVSVLDKRYRFEFVGLDDDRQSDLLQMEKELFLFKTVNQVREEKGMESLGPDGDVILNPYFGIGAKRNRNSNMGDGEGGEE